MACYYVSSLCNSTTATYVYLVYIERIACLSVLAAFPEITHCNLGWVVFEFYVIHIEIPQEIESPGSMFKKM